MRASSITGLRLPAVKLASTAGGVCNVSDVEHGILLFAPFASPAAAMKMAGSSLNLPWLYDPARLLRFCHASGMTLSATTQVFGVTTQTPFVQRIVADMLHLPFPLLSDRRRVLSGRLGLPLITTGRLPRVHAAVLEVMHGCVIRERYDIAASAPSPFL
jgi:peroxiredoxin